MKIRFLMLGILLTLYSCNKNAGTSTGNPLVSVNMTGSQQNALAKYKNNKLWWILNTAVAYPAPASLLDKSGATVILNDFWINISEIEFKLEETQVAGEVNGSDVEFAGPYLINIFNSNPQSLGSGFVANASIHRIKYKTKKVTDVSGGNPAGMVNYSLYLRGTIDSKAFTLVSGEEIVYETAGPNLVKFNSGEKLLLEVLTADIIRKIDLSLVKAGAIITESYRIPTGSPCPDIDVSASDVYTCFIKAFQQKTKVGKDANGDFDIEPSEDSIN